MLLIAASAQAQIGPSIGFLRTSADTVCKGDSAYVVLQYTISQHDWDQGWNNTLLHLGIVGLQTAHYDVVVCAYGSFMHVGSDSAKIRFVMPNYVDTAFNNYTADISGGGGNPIVYIKDRGGRKDSTSSTAGVFSVTSNPDLINTSYYNLLGQSVKDTPSGLYVRRRVYDGGIVKTDKIFVP